MTTQGPSKAEEEESHVAKVLEMAKRAGGAEEVRRHFTQIFYLNVYTVKLISSV